jgi:hypothetical protein
LVRGRMPERAPRSLACPRVLKGRLRVVAEGSPSGRPELDVRFVL